MIGSAWRSLENDSKPLVQHQLPIGLRKRVEATEKPHSLASSRRSAASAEASLATCFFGRLFAY